MKILIVVNELGSLISHRLPIAIAARNAGYTVHIAYGALGNANETNLVSQGFELHYVPIERGGTNPLTDLWSVFLLWRLYIHDQTCFVRRHCSALSGCIGCGICYSRLGFRFY
jgi:hypothetical protein